MTPMRGELMLQARDIPGLELYVRTGRKNGLTPVACWWIVNISECDIRLELTNWHESVERVLVWLRVPPIPPVPADPAE